jgi:hypothetical protein
MVTFVKDTGSDSLDLPEPMPFAPPRKTSSPAEPIEGIQVAVPDHVAYPRASVDSFVHF